MKIDNVRFKQKVIPGDTVLFRLKLASPIRQGPGPHGHGEAFVGDKLVSQAETLAQIVQDRVSQLQVLRMEHDRIPPASRRWHRGPPGTRASAKACPDQPPPRPWTADVEIGAGTWIGRSATILDGARIGAHVPHLSRAR